MNHLLERINVMQAFQYMYTDELKYVVKPYYACGDIGFDSIPLTMMDIDAIVLILDCTKDITRLR